MKNILCIDATNGFECSLLGNVNDGTNRFFLEITSDLAKNPRLVIAGETLSITSNPFLYEILTEWYVGDGTLTFNITDDDHTGDAFSVAKIASADGNLILKQVSNFIYQLSISVQNTTDVPIATNTRLGVIKVGSTLNITSDGVLNANEGGSMTAITNSQLEEILDGPQVIVETVPIISNEYIDEVCQ